MIAAFAMLALSAQEEEYLRLISIGVRLLLSGFLGYAALFKPRKSRAEKAFVWIILDPLGWLVEMALFLQINEPIFQVYICLFGCLFSLIVCLFVCLFVSLLLVELA